jgi:hypothetical protein
MPDNRKKEVLSYLVSPLPAPSVALPRSVPAWRGRASLIFYNGLYPL